MGLGEGLRVTVAGSPPGRALEEKGVSDRRPQGKQRSGVGAERPVAFEAE